MNDVNKIENLIEAFSDELFHKLINEKRIAIEEILTEFTASSYEKISRSINSRIKNENSLREKLRRKNYIKSWGIESEEKIDLQNIICEKLPDLLGFRINCYFKSDEKTVFDKLKEFLRDKDNIEVEEEPNLVQKNGHNIYKIACKYKELNNVFSFEIQIKSLLHDTWGEVEHSIVYKRKKFDSRSQLKEDIIDGLYSVLEGADKQLQKLYTSNSSKKEIERELFYIYTSNNEVSNSIHYENFFSLSSFIINFETNIERFLGKKLLKEEIMKIKIEEILNLVVDIERVKVRIDSYKWEEACKIAAHVYEFSNNDEFLKYVINGIINISCVEDDLEDSFNDDATIEKIDNDENVINNILGSLNNFSNLEVDSNGKN